QDIKIVKIHGLLRNKGQATHLGIGREKGMPVIYIDAAFYHDHDLLLQEEAHIINWEIARRGRGFSYGDMRKWIVGDDRVKFLAHKSGMNSELFARIYGAVTFDNTGSDYYVDLERVYAAYLEAGLNEEDGDINLTAHGLSDLPEWLTNRVVLDRNTTLYFGSDEPHEYFRETGYFSPAARLYTERMRGVPWPQIAGVTADEKYEAVLFSFETLSRLLREKGEEWYADNAARQGAVHDTEGNNIGSIIRAVSDMAAAGGFGRYVYEVEVPAGNSVLGLSHDRTVCGIPHYIPWSWVKSVTDKDTRTAVYGKRSLTVALTRGDYDSEMVPVRCQEQLSAIGMDSDLMPGRALQEMAGNVLGHSNPAGATVEAQNLTERGNRGLRVVVTSYAAGLFYLSNFFTDYARKVDSYGGKNTPQIGFPIMLGEDEFSVTYDRNTSRLTISVTRWELPLPEKRISIDIPVPDEFEIARIIRKIESLREDNRERLELVCLDRGPIGRVARGIRDRVFSADEDEAQMPADFLDDLIDDRSMLASAKSEGIRIRGPYPALEALGILVPAEPGLCNLSDTIIRLITQYSGRTILSLLKDVHFTDAEGRTVWPFRQRDIPESEKALMQNIWKLHIINYINTRDKKRAVQDRPCVIKIWKGYGGPGQTGLLTRIERMTRNTDRTISFGDLEDLVAFACRPETVNDNTVTILPLNMLDDSSVAALEKARARVMYINLDRPALGAFDLVPIEGIVAVGQAYINDSGVQFFNIYEFLTQSVYHEDRILDRFKENPKLFIEELNFVLRPMTATNPDELRVINGCMETLAQSA
ncbi:MAG: hypothetical protein ABH885_06770, partial [Candidatus Omnitrophota bacterium]